MSTFQGEGKHKKGTKNLSAKFRKEERCGTVLSSPYLIDTSCSTP
jgi:hypothetical protein